MPSSVAAADDLTCRISHMTPEKSTTFAFGRRVSSSNARFTVRKWRHLRHDAVAQLGLAIHPLPFEAEKILFKLVWHERTERSASHQWLRKLIVEQLSRGEHHE